MDNVPDMLLSTSPTISPVLKPPKPRIPLKDLISTAHDEDNTATRKRRVSFASVNKIKEFSAGAESIVVCHTPVYEEPFYASSDSSCPSGYDGFTPAKTVQTMKSGSIIETLYSEQKENILYERNFNRPSLLKNLSSHCSMSFPASGHINILKENIEDFTTPYQDVGPSLSKSRRSGLFLQYNNVAFPSSNSNSFSDNCIHFHQRTFGNSTRLSSGMDLTNVDGQCGRVVGHSSEPMDTTVDAAMDDSNELDFTDAVNDPRVAAVPASCYINRHDLSENVLCSSDDTKYSVSAMDLTKAAMSCYSSAGRESTRYVSNMDLTEPIGICESSALDFTDVVEEPKVIAMSTRYSVNAMDLTEGVVNKNYTEFYSNTMECTNVVGGNLEYADSDTSMDLTKPIQNIYQSVCEKGALLPNSYMESPGEGLGNKKSATFSMQTDDSNGVSPSKTYTLKDIESLPEPAGKDRFTKENWQEQNNSENENNKSLEIPETNLDTTSEGPSVRTFNVMRHSIPLECSTSYICKDGKRTDLSDDSNKKGTNSTLICKSKNLSYNMDLTMASLTENKTAEKTLTDDTKNKSCASAKESYNISKVHCDVLGKQQVIEVERMDLSELENLNPAVVERFYCVTSTKEISEINTPLCLVEADNKEGSSMGYNVVLEQNETIPSQEKDSDLKSDKLTLEMCPRVHSDDNTHVSVTENTSDDKEVKVDGTEYDIIENQDNGPEINEPDKMINKTCNDILSVSEFESAYDRASKNNISEECDRSKLSSIMQDNSTSKDYRSTPTNGQVLYDNSTNVSINDSLCSKNVTMTRGGGRGYNKIKIIGDDSPVECNGGDKCLIFHSTEQTSELHHHSTQSVAMSNATFDCSVTNSDKPKNMSFVNCQVEKGGKRSFEIAIQPENDIEESPSKQICLPNVLPIKECGLVSNLTEPFCVVDTSNTSILSVHEPDVTWTTNNTINLQNQSCDELKERGKSYLLTNTTAPSFLMDVCTSNEITSSSYQLQASLTAVTENNQIQNKSSEDLNIDGNGSSQKQLKDETGFAEAKWSEDGCENSFSLRIDTSTKCSSKSILCQNEVSDLRMEVSKTHSNVGHGGAELADMDPMTLSQEELTKTASNVTLVTAPEDIAVTQNDFSLQFPIVHLHKPSKGLENLNYKTKSNNVCNKDKESILDESSYHEVNDHKAEDEKTSTLLKYDDIFSSTDKVRSLSGRVFACQLIPKWIELQFSVEYSGTITDTAYNIVCLDRERDIGEYLLQRVKSSRLLVDVSDLKQQLQCPDVFLVRMARNLSLICKYHNGKLKGHVLTIEIVSCKNQIWAFVDINIKYPHDLSATDITISEQRIGELKLSLVRQIFSSIERGPDQLINFTKSLMRMQHISLTDYTSTI